MASEETTSAQPFFQPLPEHDNLNTAYLLAKIASKIKVTEGDCWEWQGARTGTNYGNLGFSKNNILVHRFVYSLCVESIDKRILVCHRCDNPPCCNPAHLFSGTSKDNTADMLSKGRAACVGPKGERHGNAGFTEQDVRVIRRRAAVGGRGILRQLAEEYHVSKHAIWCIVNRKTWAHVPDEEGGAS